MPVCVRGVRDARLAGLNAGRLARNPDGSHLYWSTRRVGPAERKPEEKHADSLTPFAPGAMQVQTGSREMSRRKAFADPAHGGPMRCRRRVSLPLP